MKSLARAIKEEKNQGTFLPPVGAIYRAKPIVPDPPSIARFFGRIADTTSGCWNWTGWTNNTGYGVLYLRKIAGKRYVALAHRFSFTLHKGPIARGLVIDHLCGNRACVNPEHLEAVTQNENARRGASPKTHCPSGHEYTPDNTYAGQKKCKACTRKRQRDAYHAKKAAS